MKLFINGNWGLKLLSLILAIVLYYMLKTDSIHSNNSNSTNDDRTFNRSKR